MTLKERIENELSVVIKSNDTVRKDTIRAIKSTFTNLETSGKEVKEDDYTQSLQKMVKQRKESFDIFTKQNRTDLADVEKAQIEIIEEFLPKQLSEDELTNIIEKAFQTLGMVTITKKEFGKVMGIVRPQIVGRADNKLVSDLINKKVVE